MSLKTIRRICKNSECQADFDAKRHTNGKIQEFCCRECQVEYHTPFKVTPDYIWNKATKEIQAEWNKKTEQDRCVSAYRLIHVIFAPKSPDANSLGSGKIRKPALISKEG